MNESIKNRLVGLMVEMKIKSATSSANSLLSKSSKPKVGKVLPATPFTRSGPFTVGSTANFHGSGPKSANPIIRFTNTDGVARTPEERAAARDKRDSDMKWSLVNKYKLGLEKAQTKRILGDQGEDFKKDPDSLYSRMRQKPKEEPEKAKTAFRPAFSTHSVNKELINNTEKSLGTKEKPIENPSTHTVTTVPARQVPSVPKEEPIEKPKEKPIEMPKGKPIGSQGNSPLPPKGSIPLSKPPEAPIDTTTPSDTRTPREKATDAYRAGKIRQRIASTSKAQGRAVGRRIFPNTEKNTGPNKVF